MAIDYDLLVYHDFTDNLDQLLNIGDDASKLGFPGLHVVALGSGIHKGRQTVVLAHGPRLMPEMQELLERR